jgi:hypothetical protein
MPFSDRLVLCLIFVGFAVLCATVSFTDIHGREKEFGMAAITAAILALVFRPW